MYTRLFPAQIANPFFQRAAPLCGKNGCKAQEQEQNNRTVSLELGKVVGFLLGCGGCEEVRSSDNSVHAGCLLQPTVLLMTHVFSLPFLLFAGLVKS